MLKAIETRYKGYRFRSRLEARWAVFFDALSRPWEYEAQGYDLPSGPYLPDFYLPSYGIYVEVKGGHPTPAELQKCAELRDASGDAVLAVYGLPYENQSYLFCWDCGDSAGSRDMVATWLFHRERRHIIAHTPVGGSKDLYASSDFDGRIDFVHSGLEFRPLKLKGWDAARSARFEHGEAGA